MILCLPTHVINLVINDNSLEILYFQVLGKEIRLYVSLLRLESECTNTVIRGL